MAIPDGENLYDLYREAKDVLPADRQSWVRARCGDSPETADLVLRLLAADDVNSGFLGESGGDSASGASASTNSGETGHVDSPLELLPGKLRQIASLAETFPGEGAESHPSGFDSADRKTTGSPLLDDYEILGEISSGGMGIVYRARQRSLNRPVALKMIRSGTTASPQEIHRFQAEAKAAASLAHPGIVPIFDRGEWKGYHYFSMPYVEGGSLEDRLADGPLSSTVAAWFVTRIARAVHYAHTQGIVHRDLKPKNVLIDRDDHPKVADFGLAKRLEAESGVTLPGQIMGTASYMAPEQAEGDVERISPRSDIYSLGAILYCLVVGRPPFQAASVLETLKQIIERDPIPPRQVTPSIAVDIQTICLKCLAKNPADRYETAEALAEDLQRFLDGDAIVARMTCPLQRLWQRLRRLVRRTGLTTIGALLLAIVTTVVSIRQGIELRDKDAEITSLRVTIRSLVVHWALDPSLLESPPPDDGQGPDLLRRMRVATDDDFILDLLGARQPHALLWSVLNGTVHR